MFARIGLLLLALGGQGRPDGAAHQHHHVARWGLDLVERPAQHKDHHRDNHEDGGHTEGQRIAVDVVKAMDIFAQNGRHGGRDQRAGIDGEVEEREERGYLLQLLWHLELIAAKGRYARLDAARAERN